MRMRALVCGGLLVATCAHAASALPRTRPIDLQHLGAPAFTVFTARDGLPPTVSTDAVVDHDGFVWAATPSGPYRYDGHRWVAHGGPALRQFVDDLHVDATGTLWAALRSAGIARYDGARWTIEDRRHGVPSQQVRRIGEGRDDAGGPLHWALTWDGGLLVRQGGRWIADRDNGTLPRDSLLALAQTRGADGRLRTWIGTGSQGLWYRDAGARGWRRWQAPGFEIAQVEYLLAARGPSGDALWISAFGTGLWRLDAGGLRRWSRANGALPSDEVYGIARTRSAAGGETVWVASRSGLVRVQGEDAQVFDRRHGLPSDAVRGLSVWQAPGGAQVLWLATEAGVARTIPGAGAWTTASLLGARSTGVFAVLVEPDGRGGQRLWVGASGDGLGLYERGRWHRFGQAAADGSDAGAPDARAVGTDALDGGVSMIAATVGRDGTRLRWIGHWSGQLVRVREAAGRLVFERQPTPWPKQVGNAVLDTLVRDADGVDERWVATRQSGAWRQRAGRWMQVPLPGARGPTRVGKLQPQRTRDGRAWLWASTDRGLARLDGERWTLFGRQAGLPTLQLTGARLEREPDGRQVLWLGSVDAGVVRVDVTDPLRPAVVRDPLPAPPDRTVYSATRDSVGRVYVCTNNGVQQLVRSGGRWRERVFTRLDGLVHDECNTNAQAIDPHDRFWTGTLGGLAVYDPAQAVRDAHPKPLRIVGMRVDGRAMRGAVLDVPAGARAVEVDYALLSWHRESESRFRTRLLGHEPAAGPWSPQPSRAFGALPPGAYRLRIEARDYAGNASTPLELPLRVHAHWWQTGWAAAAGVLTLLLLGYGLSQLRTRQLRAGRSALERRVTERTAELHDANARLFELSYRDALTGLANRRRLLESLEGLVGGGDAVSLAFFDVDHFKAYNDRHGHPAGDEALRGAAAALLANAPEGALVARYGGEEFACLLPATGTAAAHAFAERVRADLETRAIEVPGGAHSERIAVSAGVATAVLAQPLDTHHLLRDADLALYRAKREGRNRVRVHGAEASG